MSTRTTRSISRQASGITPVAAKGVDSSTTTDGSTKRKANPESMPAPQTPIAKKQKNAIITPSPKKTKGLYSSDNVDSSISSSSIKNRPADPNITNAPLLTPHGTRLVTYTEATADISPTKSGIPKATTTTGQILDEACAHLIKTAPKLKTAIDQHFCRLFSAEGLAEDIDPFKSLCSGIISQQVSGAAASSIKRKFIGLFNGQTEGDESQWEFPLPEVIAKADIPFLRTAGLSQRKAEYIQGLAEKFASGELTAKWLMEAPYDEMVEKLVAVRGLGKWSVEMFACFALKRLDVWSTGDLGVQRGVAAFLGKDVKKLKAKGGKWKYATEKEMEDFAAPFSPYRSLLMWYMWKYSDVEVAAIEDN